MVVTHGLDVERYSDLLYSICTSAASSTVTVRTSRTLLESLEACSLHIEHIIEIDLFRATANSLNQASHISCLWQRMWLVHFFLKAARRQWCPLHLARILCSHWFGKVMVRKIAETCSVFCFRPLMNSNLLSVARFGCFTKGMTLVHPNEHPDYSTEPFDDKDGSGSNDVFVHNIRWAVASDEWSYIHDSACWGKKA